MELYILNDNFEKVAVIDEVNSLVWKKCFNDVGYCEIYTLFDKNLLDVLQKGFYITRQDDDMVCQVVKITIETNVEQGDFLIVYATDIKSILNRRIIWNDINFSGRACDFIKKIINDNIINPKTSARQITNFIFDDSNFTDVEFNKIVNYATKKDNVLNTIMQVCNDYGYGFKITLDENNNFVFKLLHRIDKSKKELNEYVEFSSDFSNLISTNYEETDEEYKNAVLVGGEKQDNNQKFVSVSNASGLDRRELYQDSGVSKTYTDDSGVEHTYTDDEYEEVLKNVGKVALSNNRRKQSFTGEVDTIDNYVYKKDYNVGDIVKVKNEYGLENEATIVSVIESEDIDNGYECEPQFEYIEIIESQQTANILTEDSLTLTTEYNVALELEENTTETIKQSKKISELTEITDLKDDGCFPLVQDDSTRKISFKTLKNELSTELNDYNTLINKPKINSIELVDNKSFEDLGLKGLEEVDILSAIEEAEKV